MKWYAWVGIGVGVIVVGGIAASVLSRPSTAALPEGNVQPPMPQAGGRPTDAGAEVAAGVTGLLRDITRVAGEKVARDDAARERQRERERDDAIRLHAPKAGVSERNAEANDEFQ